jgi:beta-galactosidase
VLDAQDIAAMLPAQLGSGVNLYGYYMLHGGRNPPGDIDDQESTATGGYNDLPIVNYDFQAPFGANGEAHPVLGAVRPMHLFLRQWGHALAPCIVHAPDMLPDGPDDLDTPRFSVRSLGNSGFLFFNRHVRQHAMSACDDVQFSVKLETETLVFPREPVSIAAGVSFVWPFGMALGSLRLKYATAQPLTCLNGDVYVFCETPGIAAEFVFDDGRIVRPVIGRVLSVDGVALLVISHEDAKRATVLSMDGRHRLILTDALAFERDDAWVFRSMNKPSFEVAVYPPLDQRAIDESPRTDAFQRIIFSVPERHDAVKVTPLREARTVPPVAIGGAAHAALQPMPETFGKAAAWRIELPDGTEDAYLEIDYTGDIARLFSGTDLIDDHFYNGLTWRIGLRHVTIDPREPLVLTILPLRADAPIYLDARFDPRPVIDGQLAEVRAVRLVAEYEVVIR